MSLKSIAFPLVSLSSIFRLHPNYSLLTLGIFVCRLKTERFLEFTLDFLLSDNQMDESVTSVRAEIEDVSTLGVSKPVPDLKALCSECSEVFTSNAASRIVKSHFCHTTMATGACKSPLCSRIERITFKISFPEPGYQHLNAQNSSTSA